VIGHAVAARRESLRASSLWRNDDLTSGHL